MQLMLFGGEQVRLGSKQVCDIGALQLLPQNISRIDCRAICRKQYVRSGNLEFVLQFLLIFGDSKHLRFMMILIQIELRHLSRLKSGHLQRWEELI